MYIILEPNPAQTGRINIMPSTVELALILHSIVHLFGEVVELSIGAWHDAHAVGGAGARLIL